MTSTNGLETRVWLPESELRIIEAEGQPTKIMGLAAPYGRLSDDLGGFRERILPGAFTAALASGEDMRADVEHDRRMLLGRTSKGTLTFSEFSDSGLWATVTIPNTSRGRDVLEDVRNGNLDGMSVSWLRKGTEDRFTEADGETIREVLKAQLRGVALTATPAYRQTVDTLTIRSLEAFEAERIGAQVVASIERNRRRLIELEAARYPAG